MKMMQAALYARVSTRNQEQEATIESQIERILLHAEAQGEPISAEHRYIDQAVSGAILMRPGLDRLRDAAAAGSFGRLYCLSPDRLARNLGAQQVVLNELERIGVKVVFVTQPDIGEGPQAQLLLNIQGSFAEYERLVISERMRRGRLYRLRQGTAVPYPAPYGYHYQAAKDGQPSQWLVASHEAEVVKQMFWWYTQTRLNHNQIARRLNEQMTPSPLGKRWTQPTVRRIICHPAYKGIAYYNRHRTDYGGVGRPRRQGRGILRFPRYIPRTADEWIETSVPEIVDESIWQAAQDQLAMNARFSSRNSCNRYLLRSLLVCDICGHTLQGSRSRNALYYRCVHGGKQCPADVPQHTRSIRADVLEPLVWGALADLLHDPHRIQVAWAALCQQQTIAPDQVTRWENRVEALDKQRLRLVNSYQMDVLSESEFIEMVNPVIAEQKQLGQYLATAPPSAPIEIDLQAFTSQIQQALSAPDFETKQEVLRLLIDRIVVTDDALIVEHIVPTINMIRLEHTSRET